MAPYILAIDQGTTSSRAILFDRQGQVVSTSQREFPQYFPNDAWVEHDPEEIWQSVFDTCSEALYKADAVARNVAAIAITNQRETCLLWDRQTGEPLHRAIVWQDRRTADYCQSLIKQGLEPSINEKTGLLLDPYFSASKLKWLLDTVPDARARAERGELAFGTIDTYLLWRLTKGEAHRTDASNASRTMLFNIHTQTWDQELLNLFDIPASVLPEVCDSAFEFGHAAPDLFDHPIPILAMAGDQQAALFGQTCFEPGMAKSTYGTGCFFMLNTGSIPHKSQNRLLTTVAYRLKGQTTYAQEGSIFMAGATVQWLRDGLKLIGSASETESLVEDLPVAHGVFLVPAFTGLGAPHWDPHARGAILGLTRDSGIRELVSAALQSVVFQTKDLQKAMEQDGVRARQIRVDGGMAANDWLMQFLSDMLDAQVDRPTITETTALGVAYLAGLQLGWYASLEELQDLWRLDSRFEPRMAQEVRHDLYQQWQDAVNRIKTNPKEE